MLIPPCTMKMAIDKVISSLPLEFRGTDPVSACEIVACTIVSSHTS
jgi:hypothetical protein